MERSPASRLGIVAVDGEAKARRDWHFGRTDRLLGGALGSVCGARGEAGRRGDDPGRQPGRVGAGAARLLGGWARWRCPASTQLRRHDLELRVAAANPALCVGEEELLAELPDGVPAMTPSAEVAEVLDEDRPQAAPAAVEDHGAGGAGPDRLHLGHDRRARGVVHGYRYLLGQRLQARALVRALARGSWPGARRRPAGRSRLATSSSPPGLTGAAAVIHHDGRFDPAERPWTSPRRSASTSSARRRPSTGVLAKRAALRPLPRAAPDGLRRRAVGPGDDRRLPRRDRPRARRRLWPDRDRPRRRQPCGRAGPPGLDGQAAARHRGADSRRRSGGRDRRTSAPRRLLPHLLRSRYLGGGGSASRTEWWADRRPGPRRTRTAASSSRAATTTSSSPPATGSGPFKVESALRRTRRWPRRPRSPPPTPSAARSCAPSSCRASASRARRWRASLQEHCQAADRALQVPPHRRVRHRAAEDEQRQDQARAAAGGERAARGRARSNLS